jgi:hypothetical protein
MTVSSTTKRNSYTGNGSTTTFAYSFKIFDDDDITVILRTTATGAETVQTKTTHYSVTGVGSASGGNVVFGSAPTSAQTVVLLRQTAQTQATDYTPNDPFPAASHEDALDKLTLMTQDQQDELDRSIKLSRTNTMTSTEFTVTATNRANKIFAFDSSGELSVTQEIGTFRGDWAASTSYAVRDLVKDTSTNNIFIVNEAHTSSGSQPLTTNANSAKYDLIVDAAAATTSASAAASSATAAASSASTASTQASNASSSASTASTQASNAASSATAAASSATAAAASATSAATALDNFDDIFLGAKSSDPSTDNDGDALTTGDIYFNTSSNTLRVFNGSSFQDASISTTATTAELNIMDGDTSASSTTVADADRVVFNDAGTMKQVAVTDLAAYFDDEITAMPNLVTTGALNSGSITSGFGAIDNGSSNITTTGVGTFGSLDISGDIDVDGTTNLDAVDIDGAVDMASTLAVSGASTFSSDIDIQGSSGATLKLTSTVTTGVDTELLGQIDFVSSDSSTGSAGTQARIKGVYEDDGDSSGIAFLAGASTGSGTPTISEVMRIRHEGRVGIGTAAPSTALDCEGSGVPFSINSDNSNTYKIQLEDAGTVRSYLGASSAAAFSVADSSAGELLHVDSSGNLGLGFSPPRHPLHVAYSQTGSIPTDHQIGASSDNKNYIALHNTSDSATYSGIALETRTSGASRWLIANERQADFVGDLVFRTRDGGTSGSEITRFTDSGVSVGKTDSGDIATVGAELSTSGFGMFSRTSSVPIFVNRSDEGDQIQFYTANTKEGVIGTKADRLFIGSQDTGLSFEGNQGDSIYPVSPNAAGLVRDNLIDLGYASGRFDDIFATNSTINTSDENEKQNIAALTSAEITAAKAISKLFKTFKWKDKVTAKGDKARTHTGIIAQEVQAAMSDAGLDASKYAFWCSDTWWEASTEVAAVEAVEAADAVYDDDGNEISPAVLAVDAVEARDAYTRIDTYHTEGEAPEGATKRTRLGVRYPELLAFISAATEQRLDDIEKRLTALESS